MAGKKLYDKQNMDAPSAISIFVCHSALPSITWKEIIVNFRVELLFHCCVPWVYLLDLTWLVFWNFNVNFILKIPPHMCVVQSEGRIKWTVADHLFHFRWVIECSWFLKCLIFGNYNSFKYFHRSFRYQWCPVFILCWLINYPFNIYKTGKCRHQFQKIRK